MSKELKPGQAVKIHRPNKKGHGDIGCYYGPAPDPAFAFVAFNKKKPGEPIRPDLLHRQDYYPRTLYPLSQILPHES